MLSRSLVAVVVIGCGSSKAPPQSPPPPPPAVAVATCADAGILLGNGDAARAAELTQTCVTDTWPKRVIDCIASTPNPRTCLAELPNPPAIAFDAPDDDGDDPDVGGVPDRPEVSCADAVGDPANYPPVLDPNAPEREWTLRERRSLIEHECDHGWGIPIKACLSTSENSGEVANCIGELLEDAEEAELREHLEKIDVLAGKIAAARKKPATIGCKQVVAAHYADAKWKKKLDAFDAKERKRLISESRTKMTKACTADSWDEQLRACIVAGGETTCFASARMALQWGYPAAGTVKSLGVAECDAYRTAIERILACDKMDKSTREALGKAFDQMQAHMAGMSAEERSTVATSCKAGTDSLVQLASEAGC